MKKQTAIEWLEDKINDELEIYNNQWLLIENFIEQAKEMERQQIIDFADDYVDNCVIPNENMAIPTIMDVPQYYNETYKK